MGAALAITAIETGPAGAVHQSLWSVVSARLLALALSVALALSGCATQPNGAAIHAAAASPSGPPTTFFGAQHIAIQCARQVGFDVDAFATCTRQQIILSPQQQALLACAMNARETQHFASCAAPRLGIELNRSEVITADCAMRSLGVASRFAACAGHDFGGRHITPKRQFILDCAAHANDDAIKFSACSAQQIVGKHVTPEAKIALACAASSGGDYIGLANCAGANIFNVQLNSDQIIAVECIVEVGGVPPAAVGCMATRFVIAELKKCAVKGYGGEHGCFGNDDPAVRGYRWTARTLTQLTGDPSSSWRNPEKWWGGAAGLQEKRQAIWSGTGHFVENAKQFWTAHAPSSTPDSVGFQGTTQTPVPNSND